MDRSSAPGRSPAPSAPPAHRRKGHPDEASEVRAKLPPEGGGGRGGDRARGGGGGLVGTGPPPPPLKSPPSSSRSKSNDAAAAAEAVSAALTSQDTYVPFKVGNLEEVGKAKEAGVDGIIVQGREAGGHVIGQQMLLSPDVLYPGATSTPVLQSLSGLKRKRTPRQTKMPEAERAQVAEQVFAGNEAEEDVGLDQSVFTNNGHVDIQPDLGIYVHHMPLH
ncbi:unnamed protein product [Urochloa humidicola]